MDRVIDRGKQIDRNIYKYILIDRQIDRQTDRQIDRWTYKQMDRQIDELMERERLIT